MKLRSALALAAAGRRVFPITPNASKPPAVKGWQAAATTDPATITAWWTENPDYNIGVATGKGLLVVDADCKHDRPGLVSLDMLDMMGLPESFRVKTPSGGVHVYLETNHPHGLRVDTVPDFPGIDIRCEGGYVVGPGSTIDDNAYSAIGDTASIDASPAWFDRHLADTVGRHAPKSEQPLVELDRPEHLARAKEWLVNSAPEAIEGAGGDDATYRVATRLRDLGVSQPAALELMLEHWNEEKASPPWQPDELATKVDNAFRYASGGWGARTAAAEFGEIDIDVGERPTREMIEDAAKGGGNKQNGNRLFAALLSIDDAEPRLATMAREPLIDGVMHRGTFATLVGPQKSGKTFHIMDICASVATGRPWCGREVAQGIAIHIIGEGEGGVPGRLAALRRAKDIPAGAPHYTIPMRVDLFGSAADAKLIVDTVRRLEDRHGLPARLVGIDTLARAMPGGDENTTKDLSVVIGRMDAVREATKAAIILAHHTGWGDKSRSRGGSALPGAIDAEMLLDGAKITFQNMRDFEEPAPVPYRLEQAFAGEDAQGREVYSAVVQYMSEGEFEVLTEQEEAYKAALADLCRKTEAPVSAKDWDEHYRKLLDPTWAGAGTPPSGSSAQWLRAMRKALVDSKHVAHEGRSFRLQELKK